MVKYLTDDELEEERNKERREYFRYMNQLRKRQKHMVIAFTVVLIFSVLIAGSFLLYVHYNFSTSY